ALAHRIAATHEHVGLLRRHLEPLHELRPNAALADARGARDERGARRAVFRELAVDALKERDLFLAADGRRDLAEELARAVPARVLAEQHAAVVVLLHDEATLERARGVDVDAHAARARELELVRGALERF